MLAQCTCKGSAGVSALTVSQDVRGACHSTDGIGLRGGTVVPAAGASAQTATPPQPPAPPAPHPPTAAPRLAAAASAQRTWLPAAAPAGGCHPQKSRGLTPPAHYGCAAAAGRVRLAAGRPEHAAPAHSPAPGRHHTGWLSGGSPPPNAVPQMVPPAQSPAADGHHTGLLPGFCTTTTLCQRLLLQPIVGHLGDTTQLLCRTQWHSLANMHPPAASSLGSRLRVQGGASSSAVAAVTQHRCQVCVPPPGRLSH